MTLGGSSLSRGDLLNMIQLGWWIVLMRGSPLLSDELGTLWISDHRGSWIKIMSKWFCISSKEWTISKFLQMFCERILMDFKIIGDLQRLLQNGWTWIFFHGSLSISSSANPCWICVAKMDRHWSPLDDPCSNLSIWMSAGTVHPSLFLILVGWFCCLACNTNRILCDFLTCEGCYILRILNLEFSMRR